MDHGSFPTITLRFICTWRIKCVTFSSQYAVGGVARPTTVVDTFSLLGRISSLPSAELNKGLVRAKGGSCWRGSKGQSGRKDQRSKLYGEGRESFGCGGKKVKRPVKKSYVAGAFSIRTHTRSCE